MIDNNFTLECEVHFARAANGRQTLAGTPVVPPKRWPRVAPWLALAHRLDQLVRAGAVSKYADLAKQSKVTRARISQILNLLLLSPDIQEEILFLPQVARGRDPITLRQLQPIAAQPDWTIQRHLWRALRQENERKDVSRNQQSPTGGN